MTKYIKITIIIIAFFLLAYFKNLKNSAALELTPASTPGQKQGTDTTPLSRYKDGEFEGSIEDAVYGLLQVSVSIKKGKIHEITPLRFPDDNPTSSSINSQALAIVIQDAINKQSPKVDIVTGASDSVPAFSRSLSTALKKAEIDK